MPFMLSTLIPVRANRVLSRSSPGSQRKLYSTPGGLRHTIPPDRLCISLSDPDLVAEEESLSSAPDRSKLTIKEPAARIAANPRLVMSHLGRDRVLSQRTGDDNDGAFVAEAVDLSTKATCTQGSSLAHRLKTDAAARDPSLLDPSNDSCDIVEVVSMSFIDVPPGSAGSEYSRHDPNLMPLASEMFKEELYIRGYLKGPASRPENVVPRKSRMNFMVISRKVFPKALGRHQGRKGAESLGAQQDAPDGLNTHLSEKRLPTVASVTLRAPYVDGLESPGMDATTSASESFDLHEFSYITLTTPPFSPSIVLDAETFKKGVCLGDSKHAV